MSLRVLRPIVWLWLCACVTVPAAEGRKGGGGANKPKQNSTCLDVPAHLLDVILCRPTSNSVTASVLAYRDTEGCIAYGTQRGSYSHQTPPRQFKNSEPTEIVTTQVDLAA